jgi:hypothetical protein
MRLTATRVLGVLLFLCCATAAQARQWPPGPNGTFLDSLRVMDIQDTLLAPHPRPQVPDTVRGVAGIVTGFDAIPTGFGFYLQNNRADALGNQAGWQGIDIFTGSTNKICTIGLEVGDSVVVYGKEQRFPNANDSETEIEGFDNVQSTDDCFVRIAQKHTGNVPPFHIGTVAELKEIPFSAPFGSDTTREKWEGSLVQVNGPLRVVRTTAPGNAKGLGQLNAFLVVDDAVCPAGSVGPCDSMFIDGNTLTILTPPPGPSGAFAGTIVNAVRGIYNQRALGYRIQLTTGDDLNDPSPVAMIDAYPIEDNKIRVVYDRTITNGTDPSLYSLASCGAPCIVSVAQVDGKTYDVTINNGLADGDPESITENGTIRASNNALQTTPSTRSFVNGVLPISLIQAPSPDSLSGAFLVGCRDVSQFIGANDGTVRLSFRGVVTGNNAALYFLQDPSMGPRSALSVFAPICPLVKDHKYLIVGSPQEFPIGQNNDSETEVINNKLTVDEGPYGGQLFPDIQTIAVLSDTSCDASQSNVNGEDYELGLVKVAYVMVVNHVTKPGSTFRVAGPSPTFTDTMSIDSTGTWNATPPDSAHIVSVTGLERLVFGRWRVAPRTNADIQDHGLNVSVPGESPKKLTFAAFPNPGRIAKFAFDLPYASDIELSVYDLAGRRVALVAKGRYAPGAYAREWAGATSSGKAAESGVYFYRLKVGSEIRNIRGVHLN